MHTVVGSVSISTFEKQPLWSSAFKNQAFYLQWHSDLRPGAASLIMNGGLTWCIPWNMSYYWNCHHFKAILYLTVHWHDMRDGASGSLNFLSFGKDWCIFTNTAKTVIGQKNKFFWCWQLCLTQTLFPVLVKWHPNIFLK